ncbi:MAG: hypothetical protein JNL18_05945 [Planctomycetaceae bacterium]|jgi:hypothetical protein|nr:hypothetical protein [Planctomycetaceae bacterium]
MRNRPGRLRERGALEPPPHRSSGIAKLALFVGTAYLALGEHLRMLDAGVVLISDVQAELDHLAIDPEFRDRVHVTPAGRGHTLHTLFAGGTPEEQAVIKGLPGSPARYGLSRIRAAGGVAIHVNTESAEYQRQLHEQIIPQLAQLAGGTCGDIELNVYAGMSGGTGSRGAIVKARAVIKALLADTGANIDVHVHLIGGVTFNSPNFERARENAAAALADWLDFARQSIDDRVEVVLHLTELAPVGGDKAKRDQLAIDGIQAALAPELEREHYLKASNATFSGAFGNVRLIRSGHFEPLPPARIAADAAQTYLPEVVRTLAVRPDLGRIKSLDWHTESESLPHESADGLLQRVHESDAEELVASALAPASRVTATPKVRLKDGRTLNLAAATTTFATPLVTVGQTRQRICLLKTCRRALRAERDDLAVAAAELEARLAVAERSLFRAILRVQGATWLGLFQTEETKTSRLLEAIAIVHDLVAQRVETAAKCHAVRSAVDDLSHLMGQLLAKLRRLRRLLRRSQPHGDQERLPAAVVPVAVNRFWKRLLGFAEDARADLGGLQHLLAQTVDHVLLEGLATIVGATDDSLDAIVRSATARTHMELGPAWGGQERDDPASTWLVYPPVDPLTAQALLEHHRALPGEPPQIAFAKTALGSANVVSLEIRYCQRRDDAWTKFYQQGYQRVLDSERPGFYRCDPEAARRLEIEPPPGDEQ